MHPTCRHQPPCEAKGRFLLIRFKDGGEYLETEEVPVELKDIKKGDNLKHVGTDAIVIASEDAWFNEETGHWTVIVGDK